MLILKFFISFFPRFIYQQNPSRPNAPSIAQSSWVAGGYWQMNRGQTQNANETCFDRLSRWYYQKISSLLINCSDTIFYELPYRAFHIKTSSYRASSQTSGFISFSGENPFSNFTSLPNSRVNSVFGDRNSILSEPIFNTRREMVS